MYLIINDIYSIYFPYFRLFLNCLLVDRVREIAGGKPAFCTDGFNSGQSTEACKTIASVSDY